MFSIYWFLSWMQNPCVEREREREQKSFCVFSFFHSFYLQDEHFKSVRRALSAFQVSEFFRRLELFPLLWCLFVTISIYIQVVHTREWTLGFRAKREKKKNRWNMKRCLGPILSKFKCHFCCSNYKYANSYNVMSN